MEQLSNPVACGRGTVTDRFGACYAFTSACAGGKPDLRNESAKSLQFGFDVQFGDFDMSITWNQTDFENRIVGTSAQTIMELDFFNFQQATGFTGDGLTPAAQPSAQQLRNWLASGQSDPRITRAPDDIFDIIQIRSGSSNAEKVEVEAVDIQANYRFTIGNLGDFRVNLQATFIDEFIFQEDPLSPVIDGAGKYNDSTAAAPNLPEWKANLRLGWTRGNHSVTSTTHFIDSLPYDGPQFTFLDGLAFTNRPPNLTTVKSWTDMDLAYTYRGVEVGGGTVAFTVGSRNVFDRQAQRSPEFAGVIGQLQDPMGRSLYARMVFDF